MPSFLSGRQSSRSQQHQHQQQQQQQQQETPPPALLQRQQQQQHPFGDTPGSGPGPGRGPGEDPGPATAASFSNTDLPAFDSLQKTLGRRQSQLLDEQQQQLFSSQQQQRMQQAQQQLQHQQNQQNQQQYPPPLAPGLTKSSSTKLPSSVASPAGNTSTAGFDGQQPHTPLLTKQTNLEYLEQVSRSQSQRYPTQVGPLQTHQHYSSSSLGAASVDDLSRTLPISSPLAGQPPQFPLKDQYQQQVQQQQQQRVQSPPQPPPPAQETRRTTRKLFKNFLGGGSGSNRGSGPDSNGRSQLQQQPPPPSLPQPGPSPAAQNVHNNSAGLARRPSKRLSQQPPSLRTGPSQLSLDPSQQGWPLQGQQQQQHFIGADSAGNPGNTQPSPLQGIGEFAGDNQGGGYPVSDNDQPPPPSIRRVHTGEPDQQETSPYGPDDIGTQSNSHAAQLAQGRYIQQLAPGVSPSEQVVLQQQGGNTAFGQGQFDPQQQQPYPALQYQQPQAISTNTPHQGFIGHLSTTGLPQQQHSLLQQHTPNPETISQVSHESPVAEADQLAAQTSSSAGNTYSSQDPHRQIPLGQTAALQDLAPTPPPPAQHQQQPPAQLQAVQAAQQQGQALQNPASGQELLQEEDTMPPPPGGPPPNRRSQDTNDRSGQPSGGQPPPYRHNQGALSASGPPGSLSPLPPLPAGSSGTSGGPTQGYRGASDQRQYEGASTDGRTSPQPSTGDRDAPVADSEKALKELALKYKNVKRLYFEGKSQIDQLTGQIEHLQNAIANQRMSQSRTALDDSEYATRFNRLNGAITNLSFNIRKDWEGLPKWIEPYASPEALKTGKQEMTAVGRAIICRWVVECVFNRCFHPGLDPELSHQLKEIERNIRGSSKKFGSQEEFDALTYKIISWRMATLEGLQDTLSRPESNENRVKFTQQAVADLTSYLYQYMSETPPPGVDGSASMIVELAVGIASNLPMESRDVVVSLPMPLDYVSPQWMDVEKQGLPPLNTGADGDAEQDEDDAATDDGVAGNDDEHVGASRSAHPSNDMPKVRFAGFVAVEVRGRQVLAKASVWTL
ncbi:uncharacterized protein SPSK_06924 [Sporothrix schenckii 1099-18]|uniref:S-adenosylmethionine-dependent methyltransferase-like protein n=1 Tax=Sporothrix schenckii 1099-18 TaxID=1397361 RepID=A0A0F2MKI1_SPOSC|nr:uncharacterized protein SPSK_06924 [Sporothrix schenckii 1099-18]KJR88696.1 hypothetical protein SPSK_06924 [Sporothrix schenckii 1099-18]